MSAQINFPLIFHNTLLIYIPESLPRDKITGKWIQEEDNTVVSLLLIIFAPEGATSNARLLRNLIIESGYDLRNRSGQTLNSRGKRSRKR